MNKKLALLVILLVGALTSAFAGPYDTWSHYKAVTVNLTGITNANEANFPVLVRLTTASASTGSDVLSGSLTSGGLDVVFTDSTGQTAYKFERERFTSTNGEFWVRVPTLLANATTKIRIYWGKSAASDLSNSPGVWDTTSTTAATPGNAYRAVWHMNGTGSTETDVTANAWVLQATGNPTPPTAQVAAPIVSGRQLNSSDNVLSPTGFSAPNGMYFLNSVQGNVAGTGWAVGNGGTILTTTNGGSSWTTQTSHTAQNLRAVYFTDANHGIAVGDSGTIDTTASGGANWGLVTNPLSSANINLYAVAFTGGTKPSLNSGYIVGDSGEMAQITNFSTPGNAVYTYIPVVTSGNTATALRGVACDSNVCLVAGDGDQVRKIYSLQTTPAYVSETSPGNALYNFKAVTYTGRALTFIAVGDSNAASGIIFKGVLTNNNTAQALTKFVPKTPAFPGSPTPGFAPLTAVAAGVPDSTLLSGNSVASGNYGANYIGVWAVGNNGTIVRSLNTGGTWGPSPSGTSNNLTCVSVPLGTTTKYASDFGWAGGASATLLTSGNFGQWFQANTGSSVAQGGSLNITDNELNFQNTSAFTISTWVNPFSYNNDYQSIASKGDQFYTLQENTGGGQWTAGIYYNGSFDNWFTKGTGATGVEAQLGGWHYVVYTRNPPTTTAGNQIWIDGVITDSAGSTPGTSNTENVNAALSIGRTLDGGNAGDSARFFPGSLSQYTLASTVRDTSWIKAEFNTQSATQTAVGEGTTSIPISITTLPHDTTVLSGSPASFRVVATGGGTITYQWHKNGVNLSNGGNISGATSATLSLASVGVGDTAQYNVTLFNSNGDSTVTNNGHLIIASGLSFGGYTTPVNYVAGQPILANSPSVTGNPSTCVANPTLPIGLSISNTTCVISGTPTKVSSAQTYTVTASNITGTPANTTVSIQIHDTAVTISTPLASKTQAAVGATGLYAKVGIGGGGDTLFSYTWVRKHKVSGAYVIDTVQTDAGKASLVDSVFLPSGSASTVTTAFDSSKYDVIVQNLVGSVTSDTDTLYVTPSIAYSPDTVVYGISQPIATNLGNNTGGSILTCTSAPTLPAGLTLNGTTCNITGTPTASVLPTNYVITATGPGGAVTATPNITVVNIPTSLAYQRHSMTFEENQVILPLSPIVGGTAPTTPGSFTAFSGTLPAGLTLNSSTGTISGTVSPGDAGGSPYVDSILFTNAAGSAKFALTFNVFSQESYSGHSASFNLDTRASAAGVTIAQANIPILVRLTSAHLAIFQQAASNGSDVRFTDVNGNHLPYQIVHWNFGTGDTSAAIWVLANNVNANATTTINMFWGTGLSTSRSNGANVFSNGNGYLADFHLAGPSGNDTDAVSGYIAETPSGGGTAPTVATGAPIPGGRAFVGATESGTQGANSFYSAGQYMYVDDSTGWAATTNNSAAKFEFGLAGSYSITGWINDASPPGTGCCGNGQGVISHGNNDWQLQASDSEFDAAENYGNTFVNAQGSTKPMNSWHFVSAERVTTGTASVESLYVDGTPIAGTTSATESGSKTSATFPLLIGAYPTANNTPATSLLTPGHFFNGSLVEATISNTNRSPSWVKLAYKNQKASVTPIYNLAFPTPSPSYVKGVAITTDSPTVAGIATRFGISGFGGVTNAATFLSSTGLTFDTTTGKITGAPTVNLSNAAYTVTGYSDSAWSTTAPLTITVQGGGPTITSQPSALTKTVGSIGSFTVAATGSGSLTYQWQKNGVNVVNSAGHISGATAATLVDSSVAVADTGTYTVIVTNTLNATSTNLTSSGAYLTVNVAPAISAQPTALTKAVGSIGSLTVTATGSGTLSYQWMKNGVNVVNSAGHISGATAATLVDSAVAVADTGTYTVIVTNTLNATTSTITSTGAYLTVNAAPVISAQPVALTKTVGAIGSLSVTATGGSGTLSYQWMKNGVNVVNNAGHISGATTVTLVDSAVAVADTGTYTVVVTSTLNATTASITSSGAYLTVNAAPAISAPPTALTKAVGSIGSLTVTATGSGVLSYQWMKNGVNVVNSAGHISGATAATLVDSAVAVADTGTYTVIVTNTLNATTSAITSTGAYLTVNAAPVISAQPVALTKTVGAIGSLSVTATGGSGTLSYQWMKNGVNVVNSAGHISGATTVTLVDSAVAVADTGTYTVVVTSTLNATTASITSSGAYLTVIQAATITSQPVSTKIAAGSGATFSVLTSGGVGPLTYQWFKGTTALKDTSTGVSGSKTASLTLSNVAGPASDSGRLADSLTVVITNAGGSGSVTSSIAILTVNALPIITTQPISPVVGLGQAATFSVVAGKGVGPLIYQWFKGGTPLTDSTGKIAGSKTATLTVSNVGAADTGSGLYFVVVVNADSVGQVQSANAGPALALLTKAAEAAAIRMVGSSLMFQLPSGAASAQITMMDIWGRSVWSQSLGHGISQMTWNGKSSSGSMTGSGFYIVRMVLFDGQRHEAGILERKFAYVP